MSWVFYVVVDVLLLSILLYPLAKFKLISNRSDCLNLLGYTWSEVNLIRGQILVNHTFLSVDNRHSHFHLLLSLLDVKI